MIAASRPSLVCLVAACCLWVCGEGVADTPVSGDQSGSWALADSPFRLVGDVRVPPGESLTIEPGVEIIGMGNYKITVGTGARLHAVGTPERTILFTAEDTEVGWRGLRLYSSDNLSTISWCILEYANGSGFSEIRGGAVMVRGCSPTITHNVFRYNTSRNENYNGMGGAVCVESSSALIAYNLITDNYADSGGGIATIENGIPIIRGNIVINCVAYYKGGGLYLGVRSSPVVENNIVINNFCAANGFGGGGICIWTWFAGAGTYATIRNNIIAHNSTSLYGGGLYCRYDRAIITNNTIVFNAASRGGGIYAINFPSSAPIVRNTIIWSNTAGIGPQIDLYADSDSRIHVSYSDVQGGYVGEGNFNSPPLFADPNAFDYHILASSPCIDAGDNLALDPSVQTDMDGNPRYVDDPDTSDTGRGDPPIIDVGPYEFQIPCPVDFNGDGAVDTLDFLAFLNAFSAGDASADFNGDGVVNTLDFLAFLNAFNAGC